MIRSNFLFALNKLVLLAAILLSLVGCGELGLISDSDTIDTTITPDYVEPIEAFNIDSNDITVIEVTNALLPTPRTVPELTNLVSNKNQILLLDIDLSGDRDNEDFPSDRGASPEFISYLDPSETSKLYFLDLASRREQVIFDLESNTNIIGDRIFCQLLANQILDNDALRQDKFEPKQELKLLASTADTDCSDLAQVNYFRFNISPNEDNQYRVQQPVEVEVPDPDSSDPDATKVEFELQNISYSIYQATRETAPESLFYQSDLIVNIPSIGYALLNYSESDSVLTSPSTLAYDLQQPIDSDNTNTFQLWEHTSTNNISLNADFQVLNPYPNGSDDFVILHGDKLVRLSQSIMFDKIQGSARINALANPIYTWTNPADADISKLNILSNETILVLDGNDLKQIATDGTVTLIRTLANVEERALVKSDADALLLETNASKVSFLLINTGSGGLTNIVGQTESLQTFDNQDIFDYHQLDSMVDQRIARTQSSGTASPEIHDSAWLPIKNYLTDTTEMHLLHSSNTAGGILRSASIYKYDAMESTGQGELKGALELEYEIAKVIDAAIINERFGMIWATKTFEEGAPVYGYYFNPSDEQWSVSLSTTPASSDWLPFIEP
ncbi:hypothetical protein A3715_11150 [Oleiphilus sp. HI0009]|nr:MULTISPECIES: hypothetical protein [unclassified Oleiphilus]KZX77769.1 hypothetical protein A3715_11150 [Oleiphilus sp. HI0009]KZY66480.1 hypothetical protein A3738_06385 [Oleiphilus sp. HI0066]KZY68996.1 hypothetical protein A3739_10000 [Oleiphilus sp. HI0067]